MSDSSPREYDLSYDRRYRKYKIKRKPDLSEDSKYRKSKIKIRDKKKIHQKRTKQDLSDSSSSDSESSVESDYKIKRCNKKKNSSEKGPYQIMRKINGKVADDSV